MTTCTLSTDRSTSERPEYARYSTAEVIGEVQPQELHNLALRKREYHERLHRKCLRRIYGFVVKQEGRETIARLIDEDAKEYDYAFPTSMLKEAGITQENQPFEVSYIQHKTSDGLLVGQEFKPLSNASYREGLSLTPQQKEWLAAILTSAHASR